MATRREVRRTRAADLTTRAALESRGTGAPGADTAAQDTGQPPLPDFLREDVQEQGEGIEHGAGGSAEGDDAGRTNTGDEAHSPAAKAPDLTWFSKAHRATLEEALRDHPDVLEEVQKGYLRHDKFTKSQQQGADDAKARESERAGHQRWQQISGDDALRRFLVTYLDGDERAVQTVRGFGGQPTGQTPAAPTGRYTEDEVAAMTPAQLYQAVREDVLAELKPLVEKAPEQAIEAMTAPQRHQRALEESVNEFIEDSDADRATVISAAQSLVRHYGGLGNVNVETMQRDLPLFVQLERTKTGPAVSKQPGGAQGGASQSTAPLGDLARAASPKGREATGVRGRTAEQLDYVEDPEEGFHRLLRAKGISEDAMNAPARAPRRR